MAVRKQQGKPARSKTRRLMPPVGRTTIGVARIRDAVKKVVEERKRAAVGQQP